MPNDNGPWPLRRLVVPFHRVSFRFLVGQVRTWDGMHVLDLGCGHNGRSVADYAPPPVPLAHPVALAPVVALAPDRCPDSGPTRA